MSFLGKSWATDANAEEQEADGAALRRTQEVAQEAAEKFDDFDSGPGHQEERAKGVSPPASFEEVKIENLESEGLQQPQGAAVAVGPHPPSASGAEESYCFPDHLSATTAEEQITGAVPAQQFTIHHQQ